MPGKISGVARQMAELVILASCAYLAKPATRKNTTVTPSVQPTVPKTETNSALAQMFPPKRIEAINRKALRRYKDRQDLQWQRWLDSVSK